jgi:hypothetical protein
VGMAGIHGSSSHSAGDRPVAVFAIQKSQSSFLIS